MVSHDRFFLDRIVDHLFVFKGDGIVRDFPGDYSTYRHCVLAEEAEQKRVKSESAPKASATTAKPRSQSKPKLTFKERREREELEKRLPELESEKSQLEAEMSSGAMEHTALAEAADRVQSLIDEIDEAEMRLLELMEKEEG